MRSLKEERLLEKKLMNDGNFATIIEYNDANNITIQFEDGKIVKNKQYGKFKEGIINKFSDEEVGQSRVGLKKKMNCGMDATIIEYFDNKNVTLQFEDGYVSKNKEYKMFLCGKIHNKNLEYKNLIDLTGKRFERWIVLGKDEKRIENKRINNKNNGSSTSVMYWNCKCDCGNIRSVSGSNLKSGKSKSCGCYESEMTIKRNIETKSIYGSIEKENKAIFEILVNKKDGDITIGSRRSVLVKCPNCGELKFQPVYRLNEMGFSCPNCSSKISYPNRFIYKILKQLNVEFRTEEIFDWAKNKRYDFYITSYNMIIEAQGLQHYKDVPFYSKSTLKEQEENDKLKEILAKTNGIENYVQIDCRFSKFEFIKESILNSELGTIFNLSNIDWNKIKEEICINIKNIKREIKE